MIEERIEKVIPFSSGMTIPINLTTTDPNELLKQRMRQKMYLARYARLDVHSWEHREVNELNEYYSMLGDILNSESDASRRSEDR